MKGLSRGGLPPRLRTDLLDRRALALLGALCRRQWRLVSLTISANLFAVLFESSTIGVLVLALQNLAAPAGQAPNLPVIQPLLDQLAPGLDQTGVFMVLVVLAVVAQLAVSALGFSSRATAAWLQARIEGELRRRVFRQYMEMPFSEVRERKVGDLASYNDHINYVGHVVQLLNLITSQLLMAVGYLVILAVLSLPMTLVALAGAVVLWLLLARVLKRIRKLGREFTAAQVALNSRTVEFLNGLRLVRTFGREAYAIGKVNEAVRDGVRYRLRTLVWGSTLGPLTESLTILGVAFFLIGGYLLFFEGQTESVPRLVVFLFVLYRLLPRVKFINDRMGYVSSGWEFVRRVAQILRRDDKQYTRAGGRPAQPLAHGIEFRDVSLRYVTGEGWALRNLSFELPRGSMVALVGESGSGKSSVADLLIGLYEPSEGLVLVDGERLDELEWLSWREHLAVVSQDAFLLNTTVRENIAFGRLGAGDAEVREAARVAGADEFVSSLQEGYDTIVGEHGFRLSGGQRQRLAIARAVLRDPEILILDEATSQLDSESERKVQAAVSRLRADRTVLVIAHRLSTVVAADRILVLADGRLVEQGSHDELLAGDGTYARFWRLQSNGAERPPEAAAPAP